MDRGAWWATVHGDCLPMHETQEMRVQSLGQEDALEKEVATHSSICLENPMDRGAWRAIVYRVVEELDMT